MVLAPRHIGLFLSPPSELPASSGEKRSVPAADLGGRRVAGFIQDIFRQATDPTLVVPMLLASPAFQVGRLGLLRSSLARPAETWLGRGLSLKVLPALGGFVAETLVFSLSSRALSHHLIGPVAWDPAALIRDTATVGMSLGLLKAAGLAGRKIVQGALAMGGPAARPWTQADHRVLFWGSQLFGYLGLVGSHRLQGKLFPGFYRDGGNIWLDSFGTYLALGMGALGGRSLLGSGWSVLERGMAYQAHRLHRETAGPFGSAGLSLPAPATTEGSLRAVGIPDRSVVFSKEMDPEGPPGGGTARRLSNPPGFQVKDPIQSLLQALRGEGTGETVRKFLAGYSDEELCGAIKGELKDPKWLSPLETEIVRMRFLSDPPQSIHEMGRTLGFSHEWARQQIWAVSDKLLGRLLLRLNPHGTLDPVPVQALDVSVRVKGFFLRADIKTIGELRQWTQEELIKGKNFGRRSLHGLNNELARLGLALGQGRRGEFLLREEIREGLEEADLNPSIRDFFLNATPLEIRRLLESMLESQKQFDPRAIGIMQQRFFSNPPATWTEIAEQNQMEISEARALTQGAVRKFFESTERKLVIPVERLPFSARTLAVLGRLEVVTVGDLVRHSPEYFLSQRNMGKKSLGEIRVVLAKMGLSLAND